MRNDDDYYDDEGGPWAARTAMIVALFALLAVAFWFGVRTFDREGAPVVEAPREVQSTVDAATDQLPESLLDNAVETSVVADGLDTGHGSNEAADGDQADLDEIGQQDAGAVGQQDLSADSMGQAQAASTAPVPEIAAAEVTYETLPNGRPVPALVIFDGGLITVSGAVPNQSAADRLSVLALANSTVPNAEVASFVTIDPTVPVGVGVRVIEMNSARFPAGSPVISPEHAMQLERVAAIMSALPNITVEVIGHSDQRGEDATNFELSSDRARAAEDFLASQGVDPTRLSSRGAGESDLLTLNNDETALALNRRTEFVLYGLLVEDLETT